MKRFTETTKWDKAWFRELPLRIKCLWQWLCDRCDACGAIDFDAGLASFQIGEAVSERDFQEFFGDRIKELPNGNWWICGFIKFQYRTLSANCEPHKKVFKCLSNNKIDLKDVEQETTLPKPLPKGIDTLSKPFRKGSKTLEEEEEDKDKDQDQDQEKEKGECEGKTNSHPAPPTAPPKTEPKPNFVAAAAECDRIFAEHSKLPIQPGAYDRIWYDLLNKRFLPADVEVYLRWVIHENRERTEAKYRTKFHVPKMFSDLELFAANLSLARAWDRNLVKAVGLNPGDAKTTPLVMKKAVAMIPGLADYIKAHPEAKRLQQPPQ